MLLIAFNSVSVKILSLGFLSQSVLFGLSGVPSKSLRIFSPPLAARTAPPTLRRVFAPAPTNGTAIAASLNC